MLRIIVVTILYIAYYIKLNIEENKN